MTDEVKYTYKKIIFENSTKKEFFVRRESYIGMDGFPHSRYRVNGEHMGEYCYLIKIKLRARAELEITEEEYEDGLFKIELLK